MEISPNASGTFSGSFLHSLAGSFTNNGTFTAGTSTFTFNGTADQTITGATTFYNLTLNNTNGSGTELSRTTMSPSMTR